MNKNSIRKKIYKELKTLSPLSIQEKSHAITAQLFSLPMYENASNIMSYVSVGREVNTHPFILESMKNNKKMIVPVCKPDTKELLLSELMDFYEDLEKGYFGLLEPKASCLRPVAGEDLDMIVMPGVAFTPQGDRLGHGAGYYDRFLSSLSKDTPRIALAFELQLVPFLPTDLHDLPVDYIVTEKRLICCKQKK